MIRRIYFSGQVFVGLSYKCPQQRMCKDRCCVQTQKLIIFLLIFLILHVFESVGKSHSDCVLFAVWTEYQARCIAKVLRVIVIVTPCQTIITINVSIPSAQLCVRWRTGVDKANTVDRRRSTGTLCSPSMAGPKRTVEHHQNQRAGGGLQEI